MLPVLYSPVSILLSKGQSSFPMFRREIGLFLLDIGLELVLLECIPDSLGGDRVGDDGINVFGSLNCSGGSSSTDQGDNSLFIFRGEFFRMTPLEILLVRLILLGQFGDLRLANTSLFSDISRGMTRSKQRKDVVPLSSGNWSHDGM